MKIKKLLSLFICGLLSSCSEYSPPYENHGDLVKNNTMILNASNHPEGFGIRDCYMCHQQAGIHTEDRLEGVDVNLSYIKFVTALRGINSCKDCHGTNE